MKTILIAVSGFAAALTAVPALAQETNPLGPVSGYGTLGYANIDGNGVDLSGAQARLGARFGRYFGVEGETTLGLNSDQTSMAGSPTSVRLRDQYAGYAVGYLPVLPNADLFARVGYGRTDTRLSDYGASTTYRYGVNSWNYGVGGQYFFNGGPNGVRLDYTRYDYQNHSSDNDVWAVSYVRKF